MQSSKTETRRPSAVWLRHLEKMKAVVTKQKQYEQELHTEKLHHDHVKLLHQNRNAVDKDPLGEPIVKKVKASHSVKNEPQIQSSAMQVQSYSNNQNEGLKPIKQIEILKEGSSSSNESNSNSTEIKQIMKYARKPQTLSSKMVQKLQRQKERREKFIKKHEDLLNQVKHVYMLCSVCTMFIA